MVMVVDMFDMCNFFSLSVSVSPLMLDLASYVKDQSFLLKPNESMDTLK